MDVNLIALFLLWSIYLTGFQCKENNHESIIFLA